jgi:hypothetical protein
LKYLIRSPNKYAVTTGITKNGKVANISKDKLKSIDKILGHDVNTVNLMTLSFI